MRSLMLENYRKLSLNNTDVESRKEAWNKICGSKAELGELLKQKEDSEEWESSVVEIAKIIRLAFECGYNFDKSWIEIFKSFYDLEIDSLKAVAEQNLYALWVRNNKPTEIKGEEIQTSLEGSLNEGSLEYASFLIDKAYFLRVSNSFPESLAAAQDALNNIPDSDDLRAQILKFNALIACGDGLDRSSKYAEALAEFKEAEKLFVPVLYELEPVLHDKIGLALQQLNKFSEAAQQYEEVLKLKVDLYGEEHRFTSNAYFSLGNFYVDIGDIKAIDRLEKALSIRDEYYKKNQYPPEHYATTLRRLGMAHIEFGNYPDALRYLEQSLAVKKEKGFKNSIYDSMLLNKLGYVYYKLGNFYEAHEYFLKAEESFKQNSADGDYHRFYVEFLSDFAQYYLANLKHDGAKLAEAILQKALKIINTQFISNHKVRSELLLNLGNTCAEAGHYDRAIGYFDDAISRVNEIGNDLLRDKISVAKANLYLIQNKPEEVISVLKPIEEKIKNNGVLSYWQALHVLGSAYYSKGDYKQALSLFEKLDALIENQNDSINKLKIQTLKKLIDCCYALGKETDIHSYSKKLNKVESKQAAKNDLGLQDPLLNDPDKRYYVEATLLNCMVTSRTVQNGSIDLSVAGISDSLCLETWRGLSSSQRTSIKNSPKVQGLNLDNIVSMSQDDIKSMVQSNIVRATVKCLSWEKENDKQALKELVMNVAITLAEGVIKIDPSADINTKHKNLLRTHDTVKFPYTTSSELAEAFDDFCNELHQKITDIHAAKKNTKKQKLAKETAAWVEYRVNLTDHFYSDGCGKVAAVLSTFVCSLGGVNVPVFMDRKDYFTNTPNRPRIIKGEKARLDLWTSNYLKHFPDLSLNLQKPHKDYEKECSNEALENLDRISRLFGHGHLGVTGYDSKDGVKKTSKPEMLPRLRGEFSEILNSQLNGKDLAAQIIEFAEKMNFIEESKDKEVTADQSAVIRSRDSKFYNIKSEKIKEDIDNLAELISPIINGRQAKKAKKAILVGALLYYKIALTGQYFIDKNKIVALALESLIFKYFKQNLPQFYDTKLFETAAPIKFYEEESPRSYTTLEQYKTDARFLRWYYAYTSLFKEHILEKQDQKSSSASSAEFDEWNVQSDLETESSKKKWSIFQKGLVWGDDPYAELTKLSQQSGFELKDIVVFNPERMFVHSLLVHFITVYKVTDKTISEFFYGTIEELSKTKDYKTLSTKAIGERLKQIRALASKKVEEYSYSASEVGYEFSIIKALKAKISEHERTTKRRLKVSEAKELLVELLTRNIIRKEFQSQVDMVVSNFLDTNHSSLGLEKLTLKPNSQRSEWVLGGGPAAGKSTSIKAEGQGFESIQSVQTSGDVCTVNPDAVKPILFRTLNNFRSGIQKGEFELAGSAAITHEESSYIKDLIIERLEQMSKREDVSVEQVVGEAPDIILDVVSANPTRISNLTASTQSANLYVITCDAEFAVRRAFNRARNGEGDSYNRYVPTKVILEGHKKVSIDFHNSLKSGIYSSVLLKSNNYEFGEDNNFEELAESRESPDGKEVIASYEDNLLKVLHLKSFLAFLQKNFINSNAYSKNTLYEKEVTARDGLLCKEYMVKCFDRFISGGINLRFNSHTTLSSNGHLVCKDFKKFTKEFTKHRAEAVILYSIEKSMSIPLNVKDLPELKRANGVLIPVFSTIINDKLPGITIKSLGILISKFLTSAADMTVLSDTALVNLSGAVIDILRREQVTIFNTAVLFEKLPKAVEKALNTIFSSNGHEAEIFL